MKRLRPLLFWLGALLLLLLLVWMSFRPTPVAVDQTSVTQGPLVVTVSDDGMTRVKERYVVSSPLSGRLSRVELEEGSVVEAGVTPIAFIEPSAPQFLDARFRKEASARAKAAEAALQRASANLEQARSECAFALKEWKRAQSLFQEALISEAESDQAELRHQAAEARQQSAEMELRIAQFEEEQAEASLSYTTESLGASSPPAPYPIIAPITGKVLRVLQESATVVSPGTPLVELGDPKELEVIVDILSTDAVKIPPRARVILDDWGGPHPLEGVVRLVEPSAFTKISALGVEEQRVWVVIDILDAWESRTALGDGFELEPRIVIWESEAVTKIPTGALFRQGEAWAAFAVEGERAVLRTIEPGPSNGLETAISSGLTPGEAVILHPSEHVADGVLVTTRP